MLTQLWGCAPSAAFLAKQARIEETTPTCTAGADCSAKWLAARRWVRNDASFPIRVASEELIETYSGYPAQDPRLIVRVRKTPIGAGRFEIRIATFCLYDFGCIPDRWNAALAFNEAVAAAQP
jgi:hypothetical protein